MRRLARDRDDAGAITLFVVIAMPVLILFAAFTLDGARGYVARRETQNSADAAALAMATDCAMGLSTCVSGADATAGNYSRSRAQRSSITDETVSPADTYCDTTAGSCTATMQQSIGFHFAPGGGNVTRSGTAKWGTVGAADTVPIVISDCEFSAALLAGTANITLYLDDAKPQSGCASLPGGFSQLRDDVCAVAITAGGTAQGQPGAALNQLVPCITNPGPPALPHRVLIPMYDAAACQSSGCTGNGLYPILGFAMFEVTGYSFNGNDYAGTLDKKCPDETRGKYCISGDFVQYVTSQGTPGPSTDFGTYRVYLSS
jgi:Flp pilus assembly protein TadG